MPPAEKFSHLNLSRARTHSARASRPRPPSEVPQAQIESDLAGKGGVRLGRSCLFAAIIVSRLSEKPKQFGRGSIRVLLLGAKR